MDDERFCEEYESITWNLARDDLGQLQVILAKSAKSLKHHGS